MYDDPCKTRQEFSNVVGKVYNLCRVKTIRVAGVHGYGQLVRPHLWGSGLSNLVPKIMLHDGYVVDRVQDMINSII